MLVFRTQKDADGFVRGMTEVLRRNLVSPETEVSQVVTKELFLVYLGFLRDADIDAGFSLLVESVKACAILVGMEREAIVRGVITHIEMESTLLQ